MEYNRKLFRSIEPEILEIVLKAMYKSFFYGRAIINSENKYYGWMLNETTKRIQ